MVVLLLEFLDARFQTRPPEQPIEHAKASVRRRLLPCGDNGGEGTNRPGPRGDAAGLTSRGARG
jgi:hypothetical protein